MWNEERWEIPMEFGDILAHPEENDDPEVTLIGIGLPVMAMKEVMVPPQTGKMAVETNCPARPPASPYRFRKSRGILDPLEPHRPKALVNLYPVSM